MCPFHGYLQVIGKAAVDKEKYLAKPGHFICIHHFSALAYLFKFCYFNIRDERKMDEMLYRRCSFPADWSWEYCLVLLYYV